MLGRDVDVAEHPLERRTFVHGGAAHPDTGAWVDADDGTVLGYQGFHHDADVMAKTMQVVVETGMDVRDVPDRAYHPTTPELIDGLVREASSAIEE